MLLSSMTRRLVVAAALSLALIAAGIVPAAALTGWSGPTRIWDGGPYREATLGIDSRGRMHAVARGTSGLWYLTNRSGSWRRVRLTTSPLDGVDRYPSLALDDNDRVHVAFAQHTCVSCREPEADVYYLTDRGRPAGTFPRGATWLAEGDRPSLRVVNGRRYLAHEEWDWDWYGDWVRSVVFRTDATGGWTRATVTTEAGGPSLRVGSDRRARIAFEDDGGGIGYAVASTLRGGFSVDWLPTYDSRDIKPRLVLDTKDRPHIAWTRDRGAANGGGSWYAWRTGGSWYGGRFTTTKWDVQLTTDSRNRPHLAVLATGAGVHYYRQVNGTLRGQTLSRSAMATSVSIRVDRDGRPVVLYTTDGGVPDGVYLVRKK
jgi:hypothetical protein